MASTPADESTSTPGGEPASAPRDQRRYAHLACDGHSIFLQIRRRKDDKPNKPGPCQPSKNTDTEAVPNEIPDDCNMATEAVSGWNTERLWDEYRIGPEQDWIWPPDVLNSLPNGITRESQDNYQEMITEISQRRIALPKDFTLRYKDYLDVCSKRYGNSRTTSFKASKGNLWASAVLAWGALEEGERKWQGTQPWGTTQIAWIYEISESACETKSWER